MENSLSHLKPVIAKLNMGIKDPGSACAKSRLAAAIACGGLYQNVENADLTRMSRRFGPLLVVPMVS